ncbi:MAG: hypothetical protein KDC38_11905 [Planctomycetes bacterium]|nr:hypothetical protein [Planctomycetota bacterium]
MRSTGVLAWRYVSHYWGRSSILASCIALVAFLPFAVTILVDHYQERMTRRATETPLLVGAKGSRFDLLMNLLYFKGKLRDLISMADAEEISHDGRAAAIPLYVHHSVKGFPVVGTSLDYFEFRHLALESGHWPLILGDAVLGATVARELGVEVGGHVISDTEKLYEISASYPLRMRVTGVLKEAGTADDHAVFVDTKTAWIIAGIGHGHQNVADRPDWVLNADGDNVTGNAAVVEFNEIDATNLESFHFHGGPETLPLSGIIVVPRDQKSYTIVKARVENRSEKLQPVVPTEGVDELLDFVFQAKRFFDANLLLVSTATFLFVTLVVLLTIRVRRRELETLFKIGASRMMVVRLLATELGIVIAAGLVTALALAAIASEIAIQGHWLL